MEDNLKIFENGRRPQLFENGRQPKFFRNEKRPYCIGWHRGATKSPSNLHLFEYPASYVHVPRSIS